MIGHIFCLLFVHVSYLLGNGAEIFLFPEKRDKYSEIFIEEPKFLGAYFKQSPAFEFESQLCIWTIGESSFLISPITKVFLQFSIESCIIVKYDGHFELWRTGNGMSHFAFENYKNIIQEHQLCSYPLASPFMSSECLISIWNLSPTIVDICVCLGVACCLVL